MGVIVGAVAAFALLIALKPGFYPTFDEQKYLGIGFNLWAGNGPTTVFGYTFISHSPLWSAVIAMPDSLFGIDAVAWGRFLNGISGALIVGLGGFLGWRVRPAAGALAACGILAVPYLHDLSRTARLDVPAAALALLYVVLGFEAIRRGSTRWAIAAGATFAIGFLVKEIDLPYAPVPFLAGLLWGRPWALLARLGAWVILVSAIGLSWWFAMYAVLGGRVYRLDAPVWTLIPLTIGIVVAVALGLSAERLEASSRVRAGIRRLNGWSPAALAGRGGPILGWLGTAAWSGLLMLVFARTTRLKGAPLLGMDQVQLYADQWIGPLRIVAIFGVVGVLLAIVAAFRTRMPAERSAIVDLGLATICAAPLVLLVVAVGEPPRNYLAQLAVLVALASAGVVWTLERIVGIRPPLAVAPLGAVLGLGGGAVAASLLGPALLPVGAIGGGLVGGGIGLGPWLYARTPGRDPDRLMRATISAVLVASLVVATGILGAHVLRTNPDGGGRGPAVEQTAAWITDNIPPGDKVAFGSFLGYDMALAVQGRYTTVQVRHRISISDVTAPEGLIRAGEQPADDWIAVDIAPRNVNEFQAYRATWLIQQLKNAGVDYWVYATGIDTSAPTIIPALASSTGITQLVHLNFPVSNHEPIDVYVFRIDREQVAFDTTRLYIAPDALDRLVGLLEQHPADAGPAARLLLKRLVPTPATPGSNEALQRLSVLAGK